MYKTIRTIVLAGVASASVGYVIASASSSDYSAASPPSRHGHRAALAAQFAAFRRPSSDEDVPPAGTIDELQFGPAAAYSMDVSATRLLGVAEGESVYLTPSEDNAAGRACLTKTDGNAHRATGCALLESVLQDPFVVVEAAGAGRWRVWGTVPDNVISLDVRYTDGSERAVALGANAFVVSAGATPQAIDYRLLGGAVASTVFAVPSPE
jgi:hypothetical protein